MNPMLTRNGTAGGAEGGDVHVRALREAIWTTTRL